MQTLSRLTGHQKLNVNNVTIPVKFAILACLISLPIKGFADSILTNDEADFAHKAPVAVEDVNRLATLARTKVGQEKKAVLNILSQPNASSDSKLRDSYIALLDEKDSDIRDAAVVACGNLDEQRAVPKIRTVLKSLPKHRFSADIKAVMSKQAFDEEYTHGLIAAETLAKMKDMQALPEILSRDTLAVSWSAIIPFYGASALAQVIEKGRSTDARIKSSARQTILSIHDAAAASQLQALLSDPDTKLRNTAVLALSNLDSPQAILRAEPVYEQLDQDGKSYFVEGCLKHCDHAKATRYFKSFMDSSADAVNKSSILISLGVSFQTSAVPYLEQYLNDKNEGVREEAACQLAKITGRFYPYPENNTTRYLERGCEAIQELKQKK